MRGGRAGNLASVKVGVQARHRHLRERAAYVLQHRHRAGVGFAGQRIERFGWRAVGQVQDVPVKRAVGGQALQCASHGSLVAGDGRIGEFDGARAATVRGHVLQVHHQINPIAVVGQRRRQKRQVAGDGVKAALHAVVRGQDGVGGGGRVVAVFTHLHDRAAQVGGAVHLHAAVLPVGRAGDAVRGAGLESQVARQRHAALLRGRVARRQRCTRTHGDAVQAARAGQRRTRCRQHAAAQFSVHLQGARRQLCDAGVGAAVAGQDQCARAQFACAARTGYRTRVDEVVRPVEDQAALVGNVAGDGPGGAAIAHLQRARVDQGVARKSVLAGQHQRARASVAQLARAAHRTAEHHAVATVKGQCGAAGDIHVAGNAARHGAVTNLQGARVDERHTGIGIRPDQRQRARAFLGQAARAGQVARQGEIVCPRRAQALGAQHDVVGKRLAAHGQGDGAAVCPDLGGPQHAAVG
ncbi:hypothetical protein D3C72_1198590 [compost metagenome]